MTSELLGLHQLETSHHMLQTRQHWFQKGCFSLTIIISPDIWHFWWALWPQKRQRVKVLPIITYLVVITWLYMYVHCSGHDEDMPHSSSHAGQSTSSQLAVHAVTPVSSHCWYTNCITIWFTPCFSPVNTLRDTSLTADSDNWDVRINSSCWVTYTCEYLHNYALIIQCCVFPSL